MVFQPADVAPRGWYVHADVVFYEERWRAEYRRVGVVQTVVYGDRMVIVVGVGQRTVPGTVNDAGHQGTSDRVVGGDVRIPATAARIVGSRRIVFTRRITRKAN